MRTSNGYWQNRRNGVSRRRFLGTGVGAGLGVSGLALVGCGNDDDDAMPTPMDGDPGETPAPDSASDDSPRRGGTLRVHSIGELPTFDLKQNISVVTTGPVSPMFNKLIKIDPHIDMEIVGDLATDLPEQPDETTYVFHLREGVSFHSGATFTSEDVIANWEWLLDPPPGQLSTRQAIFAPVVDSIEAPDDHTVRFTLRTPAASFLVNQTVEYVSIGSKEVLERDGSMAEDPVGTGAFKLNEFIPGSRVVLDRFDDYFDPELPYLDSMVFNIVADARTALDAFLVGDMHMKPTTRAPEVEEIENRLGDRVYQELVEGNNRNHLFMNTMRAPFQDPRVREALSLVASREEHRVLVYEGYGKAIGGYMAPHGAWGLPEETVRAIPGYDGDADLAEARALIDAAGIADGTEIQFVSRNIYEGLAVFLSEQLRQLGFDATPRLLDTAAAYEAGASGEFDILPWTAVPPLDDPDAVLGDVGWSEASRNWSLYQDDRVDELYRQQTQTLDAEDRREMVNEIDQRLLEDFATIVLGFADAPVSHWMEVRNKTYHFGDNYYNRSYNDIWLAS